MSNTVKWHNATRAQPCPVCGHSSWCTMSDDGMMAVCRRVPSDRPSKSGSGWIHCLVERPGRSAPPNLPARYPGTVVHAFPHDIVRHVFVDFAARYEAERGHGLPMDLLDLSRPGKARRGERQRLVDNALAYCAIAASGAWSVRRGGCFMLPMAKYAEALGEAWGCPIDRHYVAAGIAALVDCGMLAEEPRMRYTLAGMVQKKRRTGRSWTTATLYRLAWDLANGTARNPVFIHELSSELSGRGIFPALAMGAAELEKRLEQNKC